MIADVGELYDALDRRDEIIVVRTKYAFTWSVQHPQGLFPLLLTWEGDTLLLQAVAGHLSSPRTPQVAREVPVPGGDVVVVNGIASYTVALACPDGITLPDLEDAVERFRTETVSWRTEVGRRLRES